MKIFEGADSITINDAKEIKTLVNFKRNPLFYTLDHKLKQEIKDLEKKSLGWCKKNNVSAREFVKSESDFLFWLNHTINHPSAAVQLASQRAKWTTNKMENQSEQ